MTALLLSGGPDSTVLAHHLVSQGESPLAITFDFGDEEAPRAGEYAAQVASDLGLELLAVDLADGMRRAYRKPFPQFMRAAVAMSHPVEPFGSGIALSIAASIAVSNGHTSLAYGVHKDDRVYRDNTPAYFELISQAISIETGAQFTIVTPLLEMSKPEVLRRGHQLGVDLVATWSCAHAGESQCGVCLPCTLRQEAFAGANIQDRTSYLQPRPADRSFAHA